MSIFDELLSGLNEIQAQQERNIWQKVAAAGSILSEIDPQDRKALHREIRLELLLRQGRKCALCPKFLDEEREIEEDHIVPISYGGGNDNKNIRLVCRDCNRKRGNELEGYVDLEFMIQYIEDRLRNLPKLRYICAKLEERGLY
jgi:CRISPR/Cas system Type II protein with McrA/HNH and RuvC-like nuclease domain